MKSLPLASVTGRRPEYQRIAKELRDEIIKGRFAPGSQLPSTEQLAVTWSSSVYTVHTALASLAKEGWIERIHGAGTYVAEPKSRFTCAGIYHEADIGSNRLSDYIRSIHDCLLAQFALLKKETQIFTDSRPINKRHILLPALKEAIQHRQIQCVIAPTATFTDSPALARLTVPTAYAGNLDSINRVDFDREDLLRESLRELARQGCSSVGLIAPYHKMETSFYETFQQFIREERMTTHSSWISEAGDSMGQMESFGYLEFQKIWRLRKRPEGIIVYPDSAARGVITAILKFGIDIVPRRMKFIFHRNARTHLVCPFPVTWAISDENTVAKKLIQIIETQFRGAKVSPILLPYELRADDASSWK